MRRRRLPSVRRRSAMFQWTLIVGSDDPAKREMIEQAMLDAVAVIDRIEGTTQSLSASLLLDSR